jgi:hypothetical protein
MWEVPFENLIEKGEFSWKESFGTRVCTQHPLYHLEFRKPAAIGSVGRMIAIVVSSRNSDIPAMSAFDYALLEQLRPDNGYSNIRLGTFSLADGVMSDCMLTLYTCPRRHSSV